ncbi:hypothetical protein GCM10028784_02360 [Myceligenerans cantabricum]
MVPAVPDTADDLVDRLRQRRSAHRVAAAYAAAHGHPVGMDDDGPGRRWALGARPGLVALVAVLLLACVAGAVALGWDTLSGGGVRPITAAGEPGDGRAGGLGAGEGGDAAVGPESGTSAAGGAGPGGKRAAVGGGAGVPVPDAAGAGGGATGSASALSGDVVAHVVGAVRKPGLVELPGGARIADAVEAAGGPTSEADLSGVNLARPVSDGEQIHVPRPGETPEEPAAMSVPEPGDPAGAAPGTGEVDVNTADPAALETLSGIGPALARAIIEWRTANGPFASVDELDDVPGIGPAVLEGIRPEVHV